MLKKGKLLLCVFFGIVFMLITACSKNEEKIIHSIKGGNPVKVSFSLNVSSSLCPVESKEKTETNVSKPVSFNASAVDRISNSPLTVKYSRQDNRASLRSSGTVSLSNVWVLQFDSTATAGAGNAGDCVAAKYIGSVTSGDNINPVLMTGTGQVIYVIANGPASGSITKESYTLSTFQSSAYYSGRITGDDSIPYIGRIAGGTVIDGSGELTVDDEKLVVILTRIASRISLNLDFAVGGYSVSSVKMYNAPSHMYYLNGSAEGIFPAMPSISNITIEGKNAEIEPSMADSGSYVWYTGENKRGSNENIAGEYYKYAANAPDEYCTYIRIKADKNDGSGASLMYTVFVGGNATTDFNVKKNWNYNIDVVASGTEGVQEMYSDIDNRINKIKLVSSSEEANCYMINPGDGIVIPVNVKGNGNSGAVAGTGLSVSHSAASVGLVWQSYWNFAKSIGLIDIRDFDVSSQTVTISADDLFNGVGNAVVAAYDADGTTILWSWHIWVTDYDPDIMPVNKGNVYDYSNHTWMDRNLGALTATAAKLTTVGLYYQWGRKDPFPGPNSVENTFTFEGEPIYDDNGVELTPQDWSNAGTGIKYRTVSVSNNLDSSILNPTTFYCGADGDKIEGDWYTSADDYSYQNDLLWGGADFGEMPGPKTIFDPCPAGWRVPTGGDSITVWDGFTEENFPWYDTTDWAVGCGRVYTDAGNTYYMAAGCREGILGAICNVGDQGYYWSATIHMHNVYPDKPSVIFLFIKKVYNTQSALSTVRSYGYSVRCVRE